MADSDSSTDGDAARATTLRDARQRIEDLSVADGHFVVACVQTGVVPEPVTDARFDSHEAAERACAAACRYRETLQELDPSLSRYDLDVSEPITEPVDVATVRESTDERRPNGLPRTRRTAMVTGDGTDQWIRIENCPIVHLSGPDSLLDDEVISRQLRSKL
ncbi:DUF7552 domain-containing protein [Halovivax cerinus]|uniref:DUF7552 domain-containing protein n=1 Tax=Halovivax cerinus TaxID=1487865 RepID=A0ABD5NJZ5_9EURY|nr:hypothetical protein [Halovivax cerinus]